MKNRAQMLRDYGSGATAPNQQDAFADVDLSPVLGEMSGPLPTINDYERLTL